MRLQTSPCPVLRNTIYYRIKPFVPKFVRMAVRRRMALRARRRVSGVWPISPGSEKKPAGWSGWPHGKQFAFVLTHDVEGPAGMRNVPALFDLVRGMGFRSSFNLIPEGDYHVPADVRAELTAPRFRGWCARPGTRRPPLSIQDPFPAQRRAHQPIPARLAGVRVPVGLHAAQPRLAARTRHHLRRVHVRHGPLRAAARGHSHDLSFLAAPSDRPGRGAVGPHWLRRAIVHAAAGFDGVPAARGTNGADLDRQARLGGRAGRDGSGEHPSRLHRLLRRPERRAGQIPCRTRPRVARTCGRPLRRPLLEPVRAGTGRVVHDLGRVPFD